MSANTLEADSGNNWVYPKVLSLYETVISVYVYPKVLSLYETVISVYCVLEGTITVRGSDLCQLW